MSLLAFLISLQEPLDIPCVLVAEGPGVLNKVELAEAPRELCVLATHPDTGTAVLSLDVCVCVLNEKSVKLLKRVKRLFQIWAAF